MTDWGGSTRAQDVVSSREFPVWVCWSLWALAFAAVCLVVYACFIGIVSSFGPTLCYEAVESSMSVDDRLRGQRQEWWLKRVTWFGIRGVVGPSTTFYSREEAETRARDIGLKICD